MITATDLFAGAGGLTEGARIAGIDVIQAANHSPVAVAAHAANHPATIHFCQDLHQADFTTWKETDWLLAAPCCQGHTRARGKERAHHDASRSTAWAVVTFCEVHRPEVAVIENVPEFLSWPLYPSWADAMQRLGYALSPHELDAADFGVPQNRRRLIIVATRSAAPLALSFEPRPHRPIGPAINWRGHRWSPIRKPGRAQATLDRVRQARRDGLGERFVMPYYGSGSGQTGRSLERPLGTVTTRDRWALVDGDRMRMLQLDEYRAAMSFRPDYQLPGTRRQGIELLGNAVPPLMAAGVLEAVKEAA